MDLETYSNNNNTEKCITTGDNQPVMAGNTGTVTINGQKVDNTSNCIAEEWTAPGGLETDELKNNFNSKNKQGGYNIKSNSPIIDHGEIILPDGSDKPETTINDDGCKVTTTSGMTMTICPK